MRRNRKTGRVRPGHHLMICDLSGWKMWDDEAMETWDGLWVHRKFYEERHPQDFVRGVTDDESIYPARPEGEDVFICGNMYEPDVYEFQSPALFVTCVEN